MIRESMFFAENAESVGSIKIKTVNKVESTSLNDIDVTLIGGR